MLEILVTFEEFQLVLNFMLFLTFNTIFFNSGKIKGGKNLGRGGRGCSLMEEKYGKLNEKLREKIKNQTPPTIKDEKTTELKVHHRY